MYLGVDELADLLAGSLRYSRVAVSQVGDSNTRREVEQLAPSTAR